MTHARSRISLFCALATIVASTLTAQAAVTPPATPQAECVGEFDKPETGLQGRVSTEDIESGRAAQGFRCNIQQVGQFGDTGVTGGSGGYKVHRYVDASGRECAYYDSTLLAPLDLVKASTDLPGVIVLDMSDPSNPRKTANLVTPAMLTPHESFSISESRGLLAAVAGSPAFYPGTVDVYDIAADCRQPVLRSSTPFQILGHEGNFSPDGMTYWATSVSASVVTALDLTDPIVPTVAWRGTYNFHGITVSDDGNRLYAADLGNGGRASGLSILDVSQVQARVPNPVVTEVGYTTWDTVSIPQQPMPVMIDGKPYLVEVDEFARGTGQGNPNSPVGAARIIDIEDETAPKVISDLRLEVNQPEHIPTVANDPGAQWLVGGYTGHYCSVPSRVDPGIVACSFILSGLRVFDITDPYAPVEIAYFNPPIPQPSVTTAPGGSSQSLAPYTAYAMSAPAFVPERREIWYSDGTFGFFNLRLPKGVWPE